MNTITVLMSTYNGEQYIQEQIESILNQRDVVVTLLVRDDGSGDGTLDILENYRKQGKLQWYQGKNLRSAFSFWDMVEHCDENTYYAFADQDDIWYEDKLKAAIEMLAPRSDAALYFCRKRLVDKLMNPLSADDERVNYLGLGTNLLHCRAAGCTMVFNQALMALLRLYHPAVMSMHDSWILRVASACGTVLYDERIFMDYRQHEHNVVGASMSASALWKKRLSTIKTRRHDDQRTIMAAQLYDHYAMYIKHENDKEMLAYFKDIRTSWKARRKLIQSSFLKPQEDNEGKFVKLMVLLGWL